MTQNTVWPVQTCDNVIPHHWPHPDEQLGHFLALTRGKHIFVGIENAPLKYWDAGIVVTPDGRPIEEWDKHNLILGTGLGKADEHRLKGEELLLHSTATLVAAGIGVDKDPALKPLLDALVRNDRLGHRTQFDLPAVTWALYYDGATPAEVKDISFEWFYAIIEATKRKLAGEPPVRPVGRPMLNDYIRLFIAAEYGYNTSDDQQREYSRIAPTAYDAAVHLGVSGWDEVGEILKLENRKHTYGAATLLDVYTYVEMMHAVGHPEPHVRERVFRMLSAKRQEQKLFMAAYDEIQPNAMDCRVRFVQLWRDPRSPQRLVRVNIAAKDREAMIKDGIIRRRHRLVHEIAVIETDAVVAHRAVRNCYKTTLTIPTSGHPGSKERKIELRPDIMVLRKPNRQTSIFMDRMPWRSIARRIHGEEYRLGPNAKVPVSMEVFMSTGNIREEPRWCVNDNGDTIQFLNGSLTSPGVPGTAQSVDTLVNSIVAGIRDHEEHRDHRPLARLRANKAQAPKAQGNRDPRKQKPQPQKAPQQVRPVATPSTSGGTFTNTPFAALEQVAPAIVETPVADATPASVAETPQPELVIPAPAPEPPKRQRISKPRATRKPSTKSDKAKTNKV